MSDTTSSSPVTSLFDVANARALALEPGEVLIAQDQVAPLEISHSRALECE